MLCCSFALSKSGAASSRRLGTPALEYGVLQPSYGDPEGKARQGKEICVVALDFLGGLPSKYYSGLTLLSSQDPASLGRPVAFCPPNQPFPFVFYHPQ